MHSSGWELVTRLTAWFALSVWLNVTLSHCHAFSLFHCLADSVRTPDAEGDLSGTHSLLFRTARGQMSHGLQHCNSTTSAGFRTARRR